MQVKYATIQASRHADSDNNASKACVHKTYTGAQVLLQVSAKMCQVNSVKQNSRNFFLGTQG